MMSSEESSPKEQSSMPLQDTTLNPSERGGASATLKVELSPGARIHITVDHKSGMGVDGGKSNVEVLSSNGVEISYDRKGLKIANSDTGSSEQPWPARMLDVKDFLSDHQWQNALFFIALLVYLLTRLIGPKEFPIYFFTDEAVQSVLAADFLRDGFQNYAGEFFPTFFVNNTLYCLSTSVYLQVLPVSLFGKSVMVTRGAAAIFTMLAAIWSALIMRDVFKIRIWWSAALFLSITPAWFLHSRTAFEYGMLVTFYAGFLYYYWLYRCQNQKYLYASLVCGALAFYSYMPGQVIMVVSGVLLLLMDWRYHWQNRRTTLRGFVVLMLTALPFVRFLIAHPDEMTNRLNRYRSYWQEMIPVQDKLIQYMTEYIAGLNPAYWFFPNQLDLSRHLMKGYGHVLLPMLPLCLIGLFFIIKAYRNGKASPMLAALLAAPSGSAMVALGISRALIMVIPLALLSTLGMSKLIDWIERRFKTSRMVYELLLLAILAGFNIHMVRDALINGPLWYDNYGLTGMQYGAQQIFEIVENYLEDDPGIKIDVSPTWMNGADVVARYFLSDPLPVDMASIEGYMNYHRELDENHLFIMTSDEFQRAHSSSKFRNVEVERILYYPNGVAGFYFVRLQYVDEIDTILAEEKEMRRQLLEANTNISGTNATVHFSYLDMGSINDVFDSNPQTLARTMEANPMVVRIEFEDIFTFDTIRVKIGGGPTRITIKPIDDHGPNLSIQRKDLLAVPNPRFVEFVYDDRVNIQSVEIEIQNMDVGEPSHVHLWEIAFE